MVQRAGLLRCRLHRSIRRAGRQKYLPKGKRIRFFVGELNLKGDQCPEEVVGFAVWSNRRGAKELCGLAIGFKSKKNHSTESLP